MSEGSSRDYRQALADIDITKPNVARVYDYFVGGKDNFAADREFARRAMELAPKAPLSAQNNRAFLRRVVRYLVGELGITQLIDIGSGLPTAGNVSEVAHEINPGVHVVYVDNDPVVYTHSKALLSDPVERRHHQRRHPRSGRASWPTPRSPRLIDFDRPVGLLLLAVLHHVEDRRRPGRDRGPAPRRDAGGQLPRDLELPAARA